MKTISISNRSREMKQLFDLAKDRDVVVQTPDGAEFIVCMVDDFGREVALQRRDRRLMAFLDKRFRRARRVPGVTIQEIRRRLDHLPKSQNETKIPRRKARPHSR